jgi:hypothetical protein
MGRYEFMTPDRKEEAAGRARAAADRAADLQQRRKRLEAGEIPTPEDVARADSAVKWEEVYHDRAMDRAKSAKEAAAKRHQEAAALLDQRGDHDRAEEHEEAAAQDRESRGDEG